ncbi:MULTISPECIES: hypothetical protein [unclassified Desulfovibrio]|uniref:hypothetical protein n=1 Tax=unclassified Desulfovibrio TaxID=2593640 RepID=UPI000F5DCDCE|nr:MULTISPECIES: hypothetical protein [unclassified Desulfovibrio]RRD72082.1 hypothetical protein EII24_00745 [Desulfovibrio sp. OH1209_COT-279]RRD88237.1 hypothetical protein EII23_00745 [Desulfovibrio sp. OH1186_COT-070]
MPEVEAVRREPYLKYYSEDEINEMCLRVADLLTAGKKEEAGRLLNEIPLLPKSAEIMKRLYGRERMIASGINLYEAVQEYGREWLDS